SGHRRLRRRGWHHFRASGGTGPVSPAAAGGGRPRSPRPHLVNRSRAALPARWGGKSANPRGRPPPRREAGGRGRRRRRAGIALPGPNRGATIGTGVPDPRSMQGVLRMSSTDPVTLWISQLKEGQRAAVGLLLQRYFGRLVQLARARLQALPGLAAADEDVALSAFK